MKQAPKDLYTLIEELGKSRLCAEVCNLRLCKGIKCKECPLDTEETFQKALEEFQI